MEIAVIGGGAAGLFTACIAARGSARVTLYEGGSMPGKKILATGNGRCNFTNMNMNSDCFHSEEKERLLPAIEHFGAEEVREFFLGLGVASVDRDGYVYPMSGQASSIREALLAELGRLKVSIHNNSRIAGIQRNDTDCGTCYTLITDSGYEIFADTVILACGGSAMPVTGSDGSGVKLAASLGMKTVSAVPALTSLSCENYPQSLHGVRCMGRITVRIAGEEVDRSEGELQFTRNGISGIPCFQVSTAASRALNQKQNPSVELDLNPVGSMSLTDLLTHMAESNPVLRLDQAMHGMYPAKLAEYLLQTVEEDAAGISSHSSLGDLNDDKLEIIDKIVSHITYRVIGTGDFDQAQVTSGGVSLNEIHPDTMESISCPGLYMIGEMMDVDGICGGYNLQWAWSSAYAAGTAAAARSSAIERFERCSFVGPLIEAQPAADTERPQRGQKHQDKKEKRRSGKASDQHRRQRR